jgi:GNAT superfamily N-acetyltransferase
MPRVDLLGQADLPALGELLAILSGKSADPAAMACAFQGIRANPDYHLLGAFVEGTLAGTVMGVVCLDLVGPCRPFMVVENLVVAARFRRQGLGQALLAALECRARARDCFYLMLVSGAARTGAHALYAALGYAGSGVAGFKKYL